MEVLYFKKVQVSSQNLASIGSSVTGPMVFFKDAFFIIPLKYSNLDSTTKVDGDGIALKTKDLIDAGKIDEAKKYLFENVPAEFCFKISDLDLFTLKVGWLIFYEFKFRKNGGIKMAALVNSKSDRAKIAEFYNNLKI